MIQASITSTNQKSFPFSGPDRITHFPKTLIPIELLILKTDFNLCNIIFIALKVYFIILCISSTKKYNSRKQVTFKEF